MHTYLRPLKGATLLLANCVGISGPIYFDAYRIIEFDGYYFEYESFLPAGRYVLRRVAGDFSADKL
jgi:hypothetical protein